MGNVYFEILVIVNVDKYFILRLIKVLKGWCYNIYKCWWKILEKELRIGDFL